MLYYLKFKKGSQKYEYHAFIEDCVPDFPQMRSICPNLVIRTFLLDYDFLLSSITIFFQKLALAEQNIQIQVFMNGYQHSTLSVVFTMLIEDLLPDQYFK